MAVDWINVHDFGAVGDGIADDTVAIQAAIDADPVTTLDADDPPEDVPPDDPATTEEPEE